MSYMFYECKSLVSLPDISIWQLNKKLKIEHIFDGLKEKITPKNFNQCLIY